MQALRKLGYTQDRQTGSHERLTTTQVGEHRVTIPNHEPIRMGTLSAITDSVAVHNGLPPHRFAPFRARATWISFTGSRARLPAAISAHPTSSSNVKPARPSCRPASAREPCEATCKVISHTSPSNHRTPRHTRRAICSIPLRRFRRSSPGMTREPKAMKKTRQVRATTNRLFSKISINPLRRRCRRALAPPVKIAQACCTPSQHQLIGCVEHRPANRPGAD
ncbi:type II toxin-antitoxin system HicA family toxin [Thiocapsa sp.]|uniref:type II toxin-antitoxin system HicA family toxin n=1 Tax=Thiocapsa sp. TaxID=2024551 RepID=UPI00359371DE